MRLAVSNIAWDSSYDTEIASVLRTQGVDALEVAPTKSWPDPRQAGEDDARRERERWQQLGLEVVATQSLLFGRPDLLLFGPGDQRKAFQEHLVHVIRLGAQMGARAQVFGSPKNRRRKGLDPTQAFHVAAEVFADVAAAAEDAGTAVALEANPPQYGADFLTSAHEAAALVREVGSPGLRLHLDTACMLLVGDDPVECATRYAGLLSHVHLSAPDLGPVGECPDPAYAPFLSTLTRSGYTGAVSVEMRPTEDCVGSVRTATTYVSSLIAEGAV